MDWLADNGNHVLQSMAMHHGPALLNLNAVLDRLAIGGIQIKLASASLNELCTVQASAPQIYSFKAASCWFRLGSAVCITCICNMTLLPQVGVAVQALSLLLHVTMACGAA